MQKQTQVLVVEDDPFLGDLILFSDLSNSVPLSPLNRSRTGGDRCAGSGVGCGPGSRMWSLLDNDLHGDKQAGYQARSSYQPDPACCADFIFVRFAQPRLASIRPKLTAPYGFFTQALRPTTLARSAGMLLIRKATS